MGKVLAFTGKKKENLPDTVTVKVHTLLNNFHTKNVANINAFIPMAVAAVKDISIEEATVYVCEFFNKGEYGTTVFLSDKISKAIPSVTACRELDKVLNSKVMYHYYLKQIVPEFIINLYLVENKLRKYNMPFLTSADFINEILYSEDSKPRTIVQMLKYYDTKYNTHIVYEDFVDLIDEFDPYSGDYIDDLVLAGNALSIPPTLLLAHNLHLEYNGIPIDTK